MEEIQMISKSNEKLKKAINQENTERLENKIGKSLDLNIQIAEIYCENDDFTQLIETIRSLPTKRNQSNLVVFETVKFILKSIKQKLLNNQELQDKFMEVSENSLKTLEIKNESYSQLISKLESSISKSNFNDFVDFIIDFEYDFEIMKNKKSIYEIKASLEPLKIEKGNYPSSRSVCSSSPDGVLSMSDENKSEIDKDYSENIKMFYDDGITFYGSKSKLPFVKLSVDLTLTSQEIRRIFVEQCNKVNFQIIPNDLDDSVTAIWKENTIKNLILNCVKCLKNENLFTTIRLIIKQIDNQFERLIEITTQCGNLKVAEFLIYNLISSYKLASKKIRVIAKHKKLNLEKILGQEKLSTNSLVDVSPNSISPDKPNFYKQLTSNESVENDEMKENCKNEVSSCYTYYKLLSQDSSMIGQEVDKFVTKFFESNLNIQLASEAIPNQMSEILTFVEFSVENIYNGVNSGTLGIEPNLKYCRTSVEKFLFNKLYFLMYDIYNLHYYEENKKFSEKKDLINRNLSIKKNMEYLEIRKKFQGDYEHSNIPYRSCIHCLNKIQYEISPKDKLDTLMKASLELRNCILDISHGKAELNSMDDELPLFIYLFTQVSIKNIFSEYKIIEDYLKYSKSVDKESKVLTNMMVSLHYITYQWEVNI